MSGVLNADVEIVFVCELDCFHNVSSCAGIDNILGKRSEVAVLVPSKTVFCMM